MMSDFTLAIPTVNRAQPLAALLTYLEAERDDYRVLVLDSSKPEVMAANRARVQASSPDGGDAGPFDYVVCNGILTQKLDVPSADMVFFAKSLVQRMFRLARRAIAFVANDISRRFILDHAHPRYEFTLYALKDEA